MSREINAADQCVINRKMSYFTFLSGPLSPGGGRGVRSLGGPPLPAASVSARGAFRRCWRAPRGRRHPQPQHSGMTAANHLSAFGGGRHPAPCGRGLCVPGRPRARRVGGWRSSRYVLMSDGPNGRPSNESMVEGLISLRKAPDLCHAEQRGLPPRKTEPTSRSNVL